MEVILKQDMPGLGDRNDIVKVKSGYGRNYLIPRKIATLATPASIKIHQENMKQQANKEARIKDDAQALATKIKGLDLVLKVKTSDNGKIFGSVNNIMLAEAIKEAGFDVDRRRITLKDPVRELGEFEATVKLHKEVLSDIQFKVVKE